MLFYRFDKDFDAIDCHRLKFLDDLKTFLRRNPAGPAITDEATCVQGAEVAPGGDVVGAEFKADAGRLEGPPADFELKRVVTEQAQVARPRAWGDAGQHRQA